MYFTAKLLSSKAPESEVAVAEQITFVLSPLREIKRS